MSHMPRPSHVSLVRRIVVCALTIAAVLAILENSGLTSPPLVARAQAHARAAAPPTPPPGAGSGFVPNRNAPKYPAGAWQAPHQAGGDRSTTSQSATPHYPAGRKPGEQADLRTATSQTLLNPDGTWTRKTYAAPIHYLDAQKHYQPIDNTLTADGAVAGYSYSNRANAWHVYFASAAGGSTLVHAQLPGVTVKETLDGAAKASVQLSGNQARYAGVFPGVDLAYQVGGSSL